jgi:hypothetical protein
MCIFWKSAQFSHTLLGYVNEFLCTLIAQLGWNLVYEILHITLVSICNCMRTGLMNNMLYCSLLSLTSVSPCDVSDVCLTLWCLWHLSHPVMSLVSVSPCDVSGICLTLWCLWCLSHPVMSDICLTLWCLWRLSHPVMSLTSFSPCDVSDICLTLWWLTFSHFLC